MTWQNSQLLCTRRSQGHVSGGIRTRRLRPLGTRVAAAGCAGRAGLSRSPRPGRPLPPRPRSAPARHSAPRRRAAPRPRSGRLSGAIRPPRQRGQAAPGAAGATPGRAGPVPPSVPPGARRPHRRPGASARDRPCRERGGRPRHAGAEEGAAAATMSARPSQKRGAQRTKRGGGGAGGQADPADPRGIRGARSPGNPAP